MKDAWAEPDVRDEVIDYVRYWSDKTQIKATTMVKWIGIARSKYYHWQDRYGKVNEHNAWVPRDCWLTEGEKEAIIRFYKEHPLEGYCRLAYMMVHPDIAYASPGTLYRVPRRRGLLGRPPGGPSSKGVDGREHTFTLALAGGRRYAAGAVVEAPRVGGQRPAHQARRRPVLPLGATKGRGV